MQVGDLGRSSVRRGSMTTTCVAGRAARRPRGAGRAPDGTRRVLRADQHDEIGLLEILVAAGHHVRAEGAAVAGDRRGHAEARVGVDVGRADEALHQLVGDVVVLGQQLAGDVEGDAVRAVARRSSRRSGAATRSSASSQLAARAADLGMEQPALEPDASRRAPRPSSRAGRSWPDGRGRRAIATSPSAGDRRPATPQPTPQ